MGHLVTERGYENLGAPEVPIRDAEITHSFLDSGEERHCVAAGSDRRALRIQDSGRMPGFRRKPLELNVELVETRVTHQAECHAAGPRDIGSPGVGKALRGWPNDGGSQEAIGSLAPDEVRQLIQAPFRHAASGGHW